MRRENEIEASTIEELQETANSISGAEAVESELTFDDTLINNADELERAKAAIATILKKIAEAFSETQTVPFKVLISFDDSDNNQANCMGQFLGFIATNPYWPHIEIDFEKKANLETFEQFARTIHEEQRLRDEEQQLAELAERIANEQFVEMFLSDQDAEIPKNEPTSSQPMNHVTLFFEDGNATHNAGTVFSASGNERYVAALALCLTNRIQISLQLDHGYNSLKVPLNSHIAKVFADRPSQHQKMLNFRIDQFALNEEFMRYLGAATAKTAEVTLDFNGCDIHRDFGVFVNAIQNASSSDNSNKALTICFDKVGINDEMINALVMLIQIMRSDQLLHIHFYSDQFSDGAAQQLFGYFESVTNDPAACSFFITIGNNADDLFVEYKHSPSSARAESPVQQYRMFALTERSSTNAAGEKASKAPTP